MKVALVVLGVLAFNRIVAVIAPPAVFVLPFRGDILLAVAVLGFTLPGLVLQPWSIVLLPAGPVLAPLLTTPATVLVYGWLGKRFGLSKNTALKRCALVLVLWCTVCGIIVVLRYRDYIDLGRRSPISLILDERVRYSKAEVEDVRSYLLFDFIDQAGLWSCRVDRKNLDLLAPGLGLSECPVEALPRRFFSMPPYWWNPPRTPDACAFLSEGFLPDQRGPDGLHAAGLWDPKSGRLWLWFKDNF